ncbi:MAG TPA: adenylate/guanylate cyclase domain-containing protein [Ktedonobacterales bacterium]
MEPPAEATGGAAQPPPSGVSTPPSGTVTFLFTDIEGSTLLLQRLGDAYAEVLTTHQRLLRAAFTAHGGYEVDTQGDSFLIAFPTAPGALAAAADATRALAAHPWPAGERVRVRMGLHTGAPKLLGARYVGLDLHRAARIAAAGHGGQILLSAATVELARREEPPGVTLRDLGAHRLKDLQQAERIYQADLAGLPYDFPPLKALDARPHNLPVQPGPLLGRERETAALLALLRRADARLVTLAGPGGVGKTRLSLQVGAEALDAFPDGVWFVRLSRLTDADLVIPTIAQVFDIQARGDVPPLEMLRARLRDKHLLLVLDNFEQVAAAAPQIADLLGTCPGVEALVTSRVTLGIYGEREYALRPLDLPDPQRLPPLERLTQYAAVALFIERAQAADADFAVTNASAPAVAEICARLDGLPLAIELAAARTKLLPPQQLLKRLEKQLPVLTGGARDLDERQRTMRDTIAWSYNLLSPEEQRLFRRLAVFVDGWTLTAAEAVCAAPEGSEPLGLDTLEGLSHLVDQSLARRLDEDSASPGGEPRYAMLHVIREYALERQEAAGELDAIFLSLARYYLDRFELDWFDPRVYAQLFAGDAAERIVLQDLDTLRAVLEWTLRRDQAEIGLRLALRMAPTLMTHGLSHEGLQWCERVLALEEKYASHSATPRSRQVVAARVAVLGTFTALRLNRGDAPQELLALNQETVELARGVGSDHLLSYSLAMLGGALLDAGDLSRGEAVFDEALSLAKQVGNPAGIGIMLVNWAGALLGYPEQTGHAAALAEESLQVAADNELWWGVSWSQAILAAIAQQRGDKDRARTLATKSLQFIREHELLPIWTPACFVVLIWLAARMNQPARAARLVGAQEQLRIRMGLGTEKFEQMILDGDLLIQARAALGEEAWAAAYAAGKALTTEEAIAEALAVAEEG